MVFIGRKDEIQRFQKSIEALQAGHTEEYQVFLITGEGGFGKTTLLKRYESLAKEERMRVAYLDCDCDDFRPDGGTPPLMNALADYLQQAAGFAAERFRQAFERWKNRDRENEEARHDLQVACSRALLEDLIEYASSGSPIVILLDTWEVVHSFASEWLVRGLIARIFSCDLRHRFLLVVAGRLQDEFCLQISDALHNGPAIYRRELFRFTRREVEEYLSNYGIRADPEQVYRLTRGIPLALDLFRQAPRPEEHLDAAEMPSGHETDVEIIRRMTFRFLRHLESYGRYESTLYRRLIYSMAMLKGGYYGEANALAWRIRFFRKWWSKLIPNGEEGVDEWAQKLSARFSFVREGFDLHPDVRHFIALYLRKEKRDEAVQLAQEAIGVCNSAVEAEQEKSERTRWKIVRLHFQLWAQEYRQAIKEALSLLPESFTVRSALRDTLKGWGEESQDLSALIEIAERWGEPYSIQRFQELSNRYRLDTSGRIGGSLSQAQAAARRGNWEVTIRALKEAAELAANPSSEWAPIILSIVDHLMSSSDPKVWPEIWKAIQTMGRKLGGDHPLVLLAEARILERLRMPVQAIARLQEIRMAGEELPNKFLKRLEEMERRIKEAAANIGNARTLTCLGNQLAAYGDFDEAERYYKEALKIDPGYTPAAIRLIHLLRQLDRFEEAEAQLSEAERQIANTGPAPDEWQAGLAEAKGRLWMSKGIQTGNMDDLDKALKCFESSISYAPRYANPYIAEGWVYLIKKEPQEAYNRFEEGRRILEGSPKPGPLYVVYNGMAIACQMKENPNAQTFFLLAQTLCKETKKITRPYQTRAHLGLALIGLGRFEDACEAFRQLQTFCRARGWLRELIAIVRVLKEALPAPQGMGAGGAEGILISMLHSC